jgi:hypothetical protein
MAESSLLFHFRFSLPADDLDSDLEEDDDEDDVWTDRPPAGRSLDPLSGLEGFDDEHRRWCRREKKAAVLCAAADDGASDDARCDWGVDETTRRTDEGIMAGTAVRERGKRKRGGEGRERGADAENDAARCLVLTRI